ncbi:MAG: PAS domain S-box protein, partial [Actinomycetia bacterium]|nr:PAS domain S-box protein [Actinomycetes bacterium]
AEFENAVSGCDQALNGLRVSDELYFTLFNNANDLIHILSPSGKILSVNKKWLASLEYSLDEAKELMITDVLRYENEQTIIKRLQRVKNKETVHFDAVFVSKSGKEIIVEANGTGIFRDGKFTSEVGIFRDVTGKQQADSEILELKEFNEAIVNNLAEGIILESEDGIIQFANPAMLKMLGFEIDELVGKNWRLFVPDDQIEIVDSANKRRLQGWSDHYKMELIRKDRERISVLVSGVPHYQSGNFTGFLAAFINIAEQVKLEAQLRQAQKMESVGRLAGGVAHDFNNMLSVILGNTEMAMEKTDPNQSLYTNLTEIITAAERSADLIRQLLAFARKQTITPIVLDLNETVKGMLMMIRRLIGESIDLDWMPGTEVWPIKVDPSQIDQILANLCVNAKDAIDGVGRVAIETGNVTLDESYCTNYSGLIPGDYILLTISDDGSGMDKETLAVLFEPFFTTKDIGKGTGLGLSTVYGIIKQNDGYINVYSEPGTGTVFSIYFPRHTLEGDETQNTGSTEQLRFGCETILLVEDESSILNLLTMMLENTGYKVIPTTTPAEAIRLVAEYSDEIHLLITDVIMPEMNGGDLAKTLMSLSPSMKCLFMSGYTANAIAHRGVLNEGVHFIQKPFTNQNLASKVRVALDSE